MTGVQTCALPIFRRSRDVKKVAILVPDEEPGRDRVNPDLRREIHRDIDRQPLGKIIDRRFRRRIRRDPRQRPERVHARKIQDCPFAPLRHRLAEDLTREDRPQQVQIQHPLQRVGGQIEKISLCVRRRRRFISTRAVDQYVDPAPFSQNAGTGRFDVALFQQQLYFSSKLSGIFC